MIPFIPGREPPRPREVPVELEEPQPQEADDQPGREVPGDVVPPALWADLRAEKLLHQDALGPELIIPLLFLCWFRCNSPARSAAIPLLGGTGNSVIRISKFNYLWQSNWASASKKAADFLNFPC